MTFELLNPEFRGKKEIKHFIYVPKKEAKNERKKRNAETKVLGVKPPVTKNQVILVNWDASELHVNLN